MKAPQVARVKPDDVFRYITRYMASHDGLAPHQSEIASGVGIAEGGHVAWHLNQLSKRGLIVLLPHVKRGIRLPGQMPPPSVDDSWIRLGNAS